VAFSLVVSLSNGQALPKFVYCHIRSTSVGLEGTVSLSVDYGYMKEVVRDDDKRWPLRFNSMIDALNFMAKDGWELVQVFTVVTSDPNQCQYLLRKPFQELTTEEKQEVMKN
jgi:hypothetical protein